jgi:hypothetical protein
MDHTIVPPAFLVAEADLELDDEVGRGSFGCVRQARYHGRDVVAKVRLF